MRDEVSRFFYGAVILLSAFLLFSVQPIAGRFLLPAFGGSPAVWTACMLFFQLGLLCGYGYAHSLALKVVPGRQWAVHLALLLFSLGALPLNPRPSPEAGSPIVEIILLLALRLGLPFLLLSATSPLLQHWLARSYPGSSPYRLYGLSNLGSLMALLSYPFFVEPLLSLTRQAQLWSALYALFAASCAACAFLLRGGSRAASSAELSAEEPEPKRIPLSWKALWLALPMCSSILLLAATNQMCLDVAVTPFLWILPLSLYLISFIFCFSGDRWYRRSWMAIALGIAIVLNCIVLFKGVHLSILWQISSYGLTLFAACMVCHGELYRIRPHPRRLTLYYMTIAGGGASGGIFVALIAPQIFRGYWEYHLGIAGVWVLLLAALFVDPRSRFFQGRPAPAWAGLYLSATVLVATLGAHAHRSSEGNLEMVRSFHGIARVFIEDADDPHLRRRTLMHGRIVHGYQFQSDEKRHWPTSYYGPVSGIGLAIVHHPSRSARPLVNGNHEGLRIGVVGLGVGTLATYGEAGDLVRFYELNPEVVRLSEEYFTYRRDSPARIEIVLGDARVAMQREAARNESQGFDVLAVDAFSSDAVPMHLLTRESLRLYLYHLREDGILAIHVSSRYFNLAPVVRGMVGGQENDGLSVLWIDSRGNDENGTDSSDWLLITRNRRFLETPEIRSGTRAWPADSKAIVWTDDYSNLLQVLSP